MSGDTPSTSADSISVHRTFGSVGKASNIAKAGHIVDHPSAGLQTPASASLAPTSSRGSGSSGNSANSLRDGSSMPPPSTAASSITEMSDRQDAARSGSEVVGEKGSESLQGVGLSASGSVSASASASASASGSPQDESPLGDAGYSTALSMAAGSSSMSASDSGQGRTASSAGSISSQGHPSQQMHAARKTAGTLRGATRSARGAGSLLHSQHKSKATKMREGQTTVDADGISIASTQSLSQQGEDGWESDIVQPQDVRPPSGEMLEELPSLQATAPLAEVIREDDSPSSSKRRIKPAKYDWASFAYAYARGQWDPTRVPRPPGRSNLVPGAETRIKTAHPDLAAAGEDAEISNTNKEGRRMSLDYRTSSNEHSHTLSQLMSDPSRINVGPTEVDAAQAQSLSYDDGRDRKPGRASDAAGYASEMQKGSRMDPDSMDAMHSEDAIPLAGHVSPFKLLARVNNSAPEVGKVIQYAKMAEDNIHRLRQEESSRRGSINGAKTDSLLMTQKSLNTTTASSSDWPFTTWDLKGWSAQVSAENLNTASLIPSTLTSPRPSLTAQMTGLGASASHTSRGSDPNVKKAAGSGFQPGGADSLQRPEPVPLQSSELLDDRKASSATVRAYESSKNDVAQTDIAARLNQAKPDKFGERATDMFAAWSFPEKQGESSRSDTASRVPLDEKFAESSSMARSRDYSARPNASLRLPAALSATPSSPNLSSYLTVGKYIEEFYYREGFLPAVDPPDELQRRRVLRRYGSSQMQGHAHFERIAHLAKLVFNAKEVYINLIGATQIDKKANVGGFAKPKGASATSESDLPRSRLLCGHTILQKNGEPLVVLDASQDWRFAGNPMVADAPNIRFYAGCPLQTSDGYNLGSLCICDDKAWPEFGPRQRHTLKEIARVIMRELELIRETLHLRIRDKMQHSIEHFTRQSIEMDSADSEDGPGIHEIHNLAVHSMREALNATGVVMYDLSQFEAIVTAHPDGTEATDGTGRIFLPSPYQFPEVAPLFAQAQRKASQDEDGKTSTFAEAAEQANQDGKMMPAMSVLGSNVIGAPLPTQNPQVPLAHHIKIAEFLQRYRQGHYFSYIPAPFRDLVPSEAANILIVPIFGLSRQPFGLLCAYSKAKEDDVTLEDIQEAGLQYLRAMGTIILSAVLKKDIMMADQAKSHFISNISHELRTPLHGILAAAELLNETKITTTQGSYLDTVEACGKSLLELVNHVLDFTKLSGSSQSKAPASKPMQSCDLVKLVQEVCESSWIGQMAKNLDSARHAGIGSAYAKGSETSSPTSACSSSGDLQETIGNLQVETVIDISMRASGWFVKCDAGGIRRVLMNLIGNSLKFTSKGFVHVAVREVQSDDSHIIVELSVTDTGKGISREFLEGQLFHPFTQENHLGPGTGLGLSIVNSIVQSPAINGKIDVWSTQGQGTEIRVTCELELCSEESEAEAPVYKPKLNLQHQRSIILLGFEASSRGASDLKDVMRTYFEDWWRFKILAAEDSEESDLILLNEDANLLDQICSERNAPLPPVILLSSLRGNSRVIEACEKYQDLGGIVQILFKPMGPAKLEQATEFCLRCFERAQVGMSMIPEEEEGLSSQNQSYDSVIANPKPNQFMITSMPTPDEDAVTPKGAQNLLTGDAHSRASSPSTSMRLPLRPTLGSEQRRTTHHHITPGPPDYPQATLIRRGSAARSDDGIFHNKKGLDEEYDESAESPGARRPGRSRPLLPGRSVTYHEPQLRKHVLMSPLRSPNALRDGSEPADYFGPAALCTAPAPTTNNGRVISSGASSPSTPGSVISLEGGEGAILKTAINTAGIVRPLHGPVAQKKRLQILSVEDNSINRRVLAAFFGKMDVDFVEATNGEEGVHVFESYPPFHFDVIFMDLSMPVLDGIGATQRIRKVEAERFRSEQANSLAWLRGPRQQVPSSLSSSNQLESAAKKAAGSIPASNKTPTTSSKHSSNYGTQLVLHTPGGTRPSQQARAKIFALTGRSSDEDKRRAFSVGADGFIVKPLSFKVLSSLLNNVNAYR